MMRYCIHISSPQQVLHLFRGTQWKRISEYLCRRCPHNRRTSGWDKWPSHSLHRCGPLLASSFKGTVHSGETWKCRNVAEDREISSDGRRVCVVVSRWGTKRASSYISLLSWRHTDIIGRRENSTWEIGNHSNSNYGMASDPFCLIVRCPLIRRFNFFLSFFVDSSNSEYS